MKNIIVILSLFVGIGNVYGQDYLPYYQLCNEADEQIYLKNYAAALQKFETAFENVPYVHNIKYQKASKCAILTKQYDKAYVYICQLRKQGDTNDFLNKKQFKAFKKTTYYQQYQDDIVTYDAIRQASLNMEYIALLDSLMYVDQYIIRGNKSNKGNYQIDKKLIPENRFDLDASVFTTLLEAIDKYGFPSERMLDHKSFHNARLILLHNLRLEENSEYQDWAFKALKTGHYLPNDYGMTYEQYYMNQGTTYYLTFDKDLSEENLKRLDINRAKIGLPPLRAYKITKGGLNVSIKWGHF